MKRPFIDKRILGPFVSQESSYTNTDTHLCKMLLNSEFNTISEMIEKTEQTGKEHIVVLVETDDDIYSTDIVQGDEESISRKVSTDLSMEASTIGIEKTDGNVGDSSDKHQIHTHPNGHDEQSFTDVKSIIEGFNERFPDKRETSYLVATKDQSEGVIKLFGMYSYNDLSKQQVTNMQAVVRSLDGPMGDQMSITQQKSRLIDELTDAGFNQCMAVRDLE